MKTQIQGGRGGPTTYIGATSILKYLLTSLLVSKVIHVGSLIMESRSPVHSRLTFMRSRLSKHCFKIIIVLLVVLVLVGAYHVFRSWKAYYLSELSYTVVLDCGSTGTRVNVYEWFRNSATNHDQPILFHSFPDHSKESHHREDACQYHCIQTEPGLDKFVHNSSGVRGALEPLLLWAEKQIPSERHRDTSLFLLGTAGLRRLPREHSGWILESAEFIIKKHPFLYRRSWIRVLSGQEEAYYGWVALNYKMGKLESSSRVPTLGLLDLGGSSLQVVMETDKSREDHQHLVKSNIGSIEHQILAYSMPAFGLNAAFDRTIVTLLEEQSFIESADGIVQLQHPCFSLGLSQNYTCYGCLQLNSSNWRNLSGQLQSNNTTLFYLVGNPDWEKCKRLAKVAAIHSNTSDWLQFITDMNCKSSSESTNSLNLTAFPHRVARFHALSGFFVVYNVLNLNPRANLTKILERGQHLCSKSWSELKKFFGHRKFAEQFCFRVPYLASLIEDALCMDNAEIVFGPGDVSWTLGAVLAEGEHISRTKAQGGPSFTLKSMKILSSPAFLFALFFCFLFIVYWGKVKRTTALLVSMQVKNVAAVGASLPSNIYPKRQTN